MSIFNRKTDEEKELLRQQKLDEKYMNIALREADKAAASNEVPIGCVIVRNGSVIAKARNKRNGSHSALGHAEIAAIQQANKKIGDWRLDDCTMYVTLEPCQMCAGAIVQSRIPRVVIGAMNPKAGCAGSVINILQMPEFNHHCDITYGILEDECSLVLSDFFANLRASKKAEEELTADDPETSFEPLPIKPADNNDSDYIQK